MKKNKLIVPVLIAAALVGGAGMSVYGISHAQTADTEAATTAETTQTAPAKQFDRSKGGHMFNGKTEELLTGDTAEKVKAAALTAVPGGTIDRVETDAEGDTYEAHMTKSDGSHVTIKFDGNFNVTKTETGR